MISASVKEAENGFVLQMETFDPATGRQDVYIRVCGSLAELFQDIANAAGAKWDTKVIAPAIIPFPGKGKH